MRLEELFDMAEIHVATGIVKLDRDQAETQETMGTLKCHIQERHDSYERSNG